MWRGERAAIALVFLVVLSTHLTYEYFSDGDFYFPDSFTYLTPALGVLHGHGFETEDMPETLRTPGYPMFLLPFLALKASDWSIVAVQHLLDALLAVAIYVLARRAGANRIGAIAGALVLAFDTITIHYANKILTETLSAVIIFAMVFLVLYRRTTPWLALIGLLCGALVLVRPVAIAYFVVVALWLAYVRVRPMAIVAFVLAALLPPIAWASRNAAETGVFTISPVGSMNLLMHRAAGALAMEDGGDFNERHEARMQELQKIVDQSVEEAEGAEPDELDSADLAPYYGRLARNILLHHPRGAILITLRGLGVNIADTDWDALAEVVEDEVIPEQITEIAVHVWTWLLWIATVAGLVMSWRRDRALTLLIAATIFYFIFMAAGGEAEARFRVPVIPLMAYAAAWALSQRERVARSAG